MAETREILMRTPGATPNEQALVPLAGVKDFYARDTDPGAVGTGSVWKDTSNDQWWERNVANDGWDARFAPLLLAVGDGSALGGKTAQTPGAGVADVKAVAQSFGLGGAATAGTTASGTSGVAGLHVVADDVSPRMSFNDATPIAVPVVPATPDAQDIADVLVALGLVTQAP